MALAQDACALISLIELLADRLRNAAITALGMGCGSHEPCLCGRLAGHVPLLCAVLREASRRRVDERCRRDKRNLCGRYAVVAKAIGGKHVSSQGIGHADL